MRNTGLAVAAMLAMSGMTFADAPAPRREERDLMPEEKEAQMRRELADCQAHKARLAKAAEKRKRKAAKRIKNMPPNALAQADAACGVSPGAMGSAALVNTDEE